MRPKLIWRVAKGRICMDSNQIIKEVYNGTIQSIKNVIPLSCSIGQPKVLETPIQVELGVLIGFTGDIKGELLVKGEKKLVGAIGEAMFGMHLSDDMLDSFTGELGNMIAGGLSTNLSTNGIQTDITHPTVLNGNVKLSGYKRALLVDVDYDSIGKLEVYLLLND